ncbi:hypothetical protein IMZ48_23120, partial [Candidatus Bathyarchaeota archaeon]|nr:hypothetical protein [Candidatus Bathyarchaeota archaeon]
MPMAPPSAPPARVKQQAPPPPLATAPPPERAPSPSPPPDARRRTQSYLPSSFLAPRVAVALNVPGPWHLLLFASRLLSVAPSVAWGWPSALLLLDGLISSFVEGGGWEFAETASALACIWVRLPLVSFSVVCAVWLDRGSVWGGIDGRAVHVLTELVVLRRRIPFVLLHGLSDVTMVWLRPVQA